MWVMTFHSACARMLRADAHRLGYTRQFTIYDAADSRRLIKKCLDDLDIDAKRFTPRAMQAQISDAKNKLRSADDYRQLVGSYFEQTVADVYEHYERELHRMNAMDFDDLLVRAVNVLELFQEVRDRYATASAGSSSTSTRTPTTPSTAGSSCSTSEHRNLAVVGDDDQCLVEGTLVTMADGTKRPIEEIRVGDEVLSGYGSGDFRPARVTGAFQSRQPMGVAITTAAGRRIVSTPEHVHFAGYRSGHTPQLHMTYLMWQRDAASASARRGRSPTPGSSGRSAACSSGRCRKAPTPRGSCRPTPRRARHASPRRQRRSATSCRRCRSSRGRAAASTGWSATRS